MTEQGQKGIDRRTLGRAVGVGAAVAIANRFLTGDSAPLRTSYEARPAPVENLAVFPRAVQNTVANLSEAFFSVYMQNQQSIDSNLVIAGNPNTMTPSLGLTLPNAPEAFPHRSPVGMTLTFTRSAGEQLAQLSPGDGPPFLKNLANNVTALTLTVTAESPNEYETITVARTPSGEWTCSGQVEIQRQGKKPAYYPVRYTTDQSMITARKADTLDNSVLQDIAGGGTEVLVTLQNAVEGTINPLA